MEAPQITPGPRKTKLEPGIPPKDEGLSHAQRDAIHGLIGKQVVHRLGSPSRPVQGASPAGRRGPLSSEYRRRQASHFLKDRPKLFRGGRRRRQHPQLNSDDRAGVLTAGQAERERKARRGGVSSRGQSPSPTHSTVAAHGARSITVWRRDGSV